MLDGVVPWPREFQERYRARGYWQGTTLGEAFDRAVGAAPGVRDVRRAPLRHSARRSRRGDRGDPGAPDVARRRDPHRGRRGQARPAGRGRGPYTIRGYYRAEEHNRVAFSHDGFYRTGDLVRLHPSGNLIVEGRKKDMINRGGEKISTEEPR